MLYFFATTCKANGGVSTNCNTMAYTYCMVHADTLTVNINSMQTRMKLLLLMFKDILLLQHGAIHFAIEFFVAGKELRFLCVFIFTIMLAFSMRAVE